MNINFIDLLISCLLTPYGAVGIIIGVLVIIKASRDRYTGWMIFSFCCFAASLSKFEDQWIKEPPALLFPLQQIREYGRPLAIIFLIFLIILALQAQNNWRKSIFPPAVKYLTFVQIVFFLKTSMYGSLEFALLSAVTFIGVIFMLRMGPGRWLQNDDDFNFAARSIALVGLIFVLTNTYQYSIDPHAVTFSHNRFLGTTGNPQHAAVLLAATVPCLMFVIHCFSRSNYLKYLWVIVLIIVMYFLILTGSRTGLLMSTISILLFYRNNRGAWFKIILFVAATAVIVMPFFEHTTLTSSLGISSSVSDRFSSGNNTRTDVWNGLWKNFSDNILFGEPLQGDRMGYGENSWLCVASNLGLVGFIPMIIMGCESVKTIWQLFQLSNRDSYYFFQSSVVIAGLGSMLVGSFFEAFLMGTITFPQMAFLTYLMMGGYLIEVDRVRTHYARAEAESEFADRSGVY